MSEPVLADKKPAVLELESGITTGVVAVNLKTNPFVKVHIKAQNLRC